MDKLRHGLEMGRGIVAESCEMLRQTYNHAISRSTMYNALTADPTLKEFQKQCRMIVFDCCYHGIVGRAEGGNARDQRLLFGRLADENGIPKPTTAPKFPTGSAEGEPGQELVADGGLTREQIAALNDAELATLLAAERILYAKRLAISNAQARLA